MYSYTRPQ